MKCLSWYLAWTTSSKNNIIFLSLYHPSGTQELVYTSYFSFLLLWAPLFWSLGSWLITEFLWLLKMGLPVLKGRNVFNFLEKDSSCLRFLIPSSHRYLSKSCSEWYICFNNYWIFLFFLFFRNSMLHLLQEQLNTFSGVCWVLQRKIVPYAYSYTKD